MAPGKPDSSEYPPHFSNYVSIVNEDDIVAALETQRQTALALLHEIDEAGAGFRYEPSKWTIKELVGHIIDAERAFAFRAFHFARNHTTPLPGFEQNSAAVAAGHGRLTLREIAEEYDSVRRSTLFMFRHLDPESWLRRGIANGSEATVRALAYVIVGHERHHLRILRTRYLDILTPTR